MRTRLTMIEMAAGGVQQSGVFGAKPAPEPIEKKLSHGRLVVAAGNGGQLLAVAMPMADKRLFLLLGVKRHHI